MKRSDLLKFTPVLAMLAGIAAMFLRRQLYVNAVDATGRIAANHPLSWVLAGLSLAVVVLCALAVRNQKGEGGFAGNFSGGANVCAEYCFFAFGIAFTVLRNDAPMPGTLGLAWKVLGILSAPCLVWSGWRRLLEKTPPLAAAIVPTAFLTVHLINHYQLWCSNPQLLDVVFPLFATVALTITAYQQAAFAADMGSRRQQLLAGTLAIYLCFGELAVYGYSMLYLTGAMWASSSLCTWKAV